jgi:hypothetical protein
MTDVFDRHGEPNIRAAIDAAEEVQQLPDDPDASLTPQFEQEDAAEAKTPNGEKPKQLDILIEIAGEADFFQTPEGRAFADIENDDHRETWPLRSKQFNHWLKVGFYRVTGGTPRPEALQSALDLIEVRAQSSAPERIVHLRVGEHAGKRYVDLADKEWRAVEIDETGWRVIVRPPVRFRRTPGMRALPVPVPGGSIKALRSFLNVKSENDFVLVISWLLTGMRNCGPYPVLVLSGEQGSAKSTFSKTLRYLLDPNVAPLRALPENNRDSFIAANNSHVLAFDNVSNLPAGISDTLCRLATGGGFAVRQLYTDQDEVLFVAARPVILNGIEEIVTRPDLADRALFLTLEAIPEDRRKTEAELRIRFEAEHARILGALLDAMVEGLRRISGIRLTKLPRMADFAEWATACETAFWSPGTFMAAFADNRNRAVDDVVDADPVSAAVRAIMSSRTEWRGTATELLEFLGTFAGERVVKSKNWPVSPRALANRLRRSATFLRSIGIEIGFDREGRAGTRIIRITAAAANTAGLPPSAPSAPTRNPGDANTLSTPDRQTPCDAADGDSSLVAKSVSGKRLKSNGADDADGADANFPSPYVPMKSGWRARI